SGNLPVFTIYNDDGPMIAPQTYEVRDSAGNVVDSGSFQLARGAAPMTVSLPAGSNPYETYTFYSDGAVGTFEVDHDCAQQPVLLITSVCSVTDAFTITNTSANDMVIPQDYTITNSA